MAALLILSSLVAFIAGQLLLKHAMAAQLGSRRFVTYLSAGMVAMTFSFFVMLGLLQSFDLSYLYPFQGLSVIMITLLAAVILKEALSLRLVLGAALISCGVVLVSLS